MVKKLRLFVKEMSVPAEPARYWVCIPLDVSRFAYLSQVVDSMSRLLKNGESVRKQPT